MQAATSSQGYGQWQWTSFFLCCATASANGICQRRPTAQGLLSPWPTASPLVRSVTVLVGSPWSISISLLPSAKAIKLLPPSDTWCVLRQCCGHPASSVPAKSHRFRRSTQISSSMPCSGFKVIAFLHWVVPPQWSLWRLQIAPQPVWDPWEYIGAIWKGPHGTPPSPQAHTWTIERTRQQVYQMHPAEIKILYSHPAQGHIWLVHQSTTPGQRPASFGHKPGNLHKKPRQYSL